MPGPLEATARQFMSALDAMDVDRLMAGASADMQGVDEISRGWLRGWDEVDRYLRHLLGAVSNVSTEIRDVHEEIWGDTGVLTCWLDQDYMLAGGAQHVSAPTTMIFRREDGDWKAALFHSIPLAGDE